MKKFTKPQLESVVSSFFYCITDWQGHTKEEQERAYERKLARLTMLAEEISEMVLNCNVYAKRSYSFESATQSVPLKLQEFKDLRKSIFPPNVIPFPTQHFFK